MAWGMAGNLPNNIEEKGCQKNLDVEGCGGEVTDLLKIYLILKFGAW